MKNYDDKQSMLLKKIEAAKAKMDALKNRRAREIGLIAMNYGLERHDNEYLSEQFSKIAGSSVISFEANE